MVKPERYNRNRFPDNSANPFWRHIAAKWKNIPIGLGKRKFSLSWITKDARKKFKLRNMVDITAIKSKFQQSWKTFKDARSKVKTEYLSKLQYSTVRILRVAFLIA